MIMTLSEDVDFETLGKIGGCRLAQGGMPLAGDVAVVPVAQRLDRRLDDEIGVLKSG
jgi:hypothetical protein